jgi:ABC-type transport system involved in multi-copper enzyme maturation permease subunit
MNPVLVNDLRKSIFRRKPVLAVLYMALGILVLTFGVSTLIPGAGSYGRNLFPIFRFPDLLLPLIAPAFAAGAFAKEHEQRTWQDILLTRLSAVEILWGKFLACALPTAVALVVLFPPFALLLIIMGMDAAMEAGPWMFIIGFKVAVGLLFYITVALVCSYHSPNARAALVIGYCALAAFGVLNFTVYRFVIEPILFPIPISYYDSTGGYWISSEYHRSAPYALTAVDWMVLLEAGLIAAGLLVHLLVRIRMRRA